MLTSILNKPTPGSTTETAGTTTIQRMDEHGNHRPRPTTVTTDNVIDNASDDAFTAILKEDVRNGELTRVSLYILTS